MNKSVTCMFKKCNKYLLDPIILSCSNNVCKCHVDELIDQTAEAYICFVCNQQHKIPNDGFIINTALANIINLNLHLNENEKKAADLVSQLKTNFSRVEKIDNDPEGFIFDYISETRNKIDLERVRLIYEINTLSDEMLNQLKHLEDECNKNLKTLNINKNEKKNTNFENLSNDISQWTDVIRTPKNSKEVIDKLIDDANKLIKETEEIILNNKKTLLMDKSCYFNAMNTQFDQKLFGDFYVGANNYLKSSILTSKQSDDLIKLCEFDSKSQFKLLYQATRDGFDAQKFHANCDGKPKTLTIVKVKGNTNVFGGFCNLSWDQSSQYKNDSKAFIFSLINKDNRPLKINVTNPSYTIYSRSDYGPTFGGGHDFHISNNSNTNLTSYSNFGHSYANNLYQNGTTVAQNFLAGSNKFSTEEIEVFQII